jgi:ABC-type transporter Mla subunit MlaD
MMTTELTAQSGRGAAKQNDVPNGKPFQQIQAQLDALDQRILAMQTQINGVEASLQAQIGAISSSYASLQRWIDSVDAALASIDSRVDANHAMIAALNEAVGSLQASLAAVQTELAGLQAGADANTAATLALQAQAAQLQTLITAHTTQIATLQGQVASTNEFLATMVNATCSAQQAIGDIGPSGSIMCMTPSAGGVELLMTQFAWNFGPNALRTFELFCPAGYRAVSGGYDGAFGIAVVSAFTNPTSYVVRVQSPWVNSSIQVLATCVK